MNCFLIERSQGNVRENKRLQWRRSQVGYKEVNKKKKNNEGNPHHGMFRVSSYLLPSFPTDIKVQNFTEKDEKMTPER